MNRIKRTSLRTGAISHTSIIARLWTTTWHEGHRRTIFYSSIFIAHFSFLTGSSTLNKRNFLCSCFSFNSHNLSNLCSNRISTYWTLSNRGFPFCNCCRKPGTTSVSTATTVVSRKHFKHCFLFRIYFHFKFLTRDSKEQSKNNTYTAHYDSCHNNCSNIHLPFPPKSFLRIP